MNRSNAGPGSGNPMRHAKSAIWLGALIGLYAVLSGWAAARNEPQSFGDTYRYLENSFLDIQNPGITPSLILQLAGEPNRMLWVQVVISIMAWAALSIAIIMRTRFHPIGWILGVVVLAISLVTPVWSWNSLLASESTAISVGILWLAALIWASDRATGPRLTTLTIAGGLLTVTRPQTAIAVLAITLVYAIWWGRRRSAVLVPILAALSGVGFFTWGVYRLLSLATEPAYRLYYATNNLLDKGSYRDYALGQAPACQPLNDLIVGPQPWPDLFIFRSSQFASACPETWLWFRSDEAGTLKWLLGQPLAVFDNFRQVFPSIALPTYSEGQALPESLNGAMVPTVTFWALALVALALGVVLAFLAGVRLHPTVWGLVSSLVVVGALVVTPVLIWSADGIEHDRHLMPYTLLVVVSALVLPTTLPFARQDRST